MLYSFKDYINYTWSNILKGSCYKKPNTQELYFICTYQAIFSVLHYFSEAITTSSIREPPPYLLSVVSQIILHNILHFVHYASLL